MIYTITLCPYLNRVVEVDEFIYDDVNNILQENRKAGGRGIDISRVVKELGGQSVALGFAGGYNGSELEGRLKNEGVLCDFTKINGETRANYVIFQRKKKSKTLLSTDEPEIGQHEVAALLNRIKEIPADSDNYAIISGSTPKGVDDDLLVQIIIILKDKGVKTIIDTDGVTLKMAVDACPYLIKPNIHEFGRLVGKNISSVDDIIDCAKYFEDMLEYLVVSMGARGAVGINNNGNYLVIPPKIKAGSLTGAGDSFVAGMVYAMSEKRDFADAMTLGVACGTASAISPENELCRKDDVEIIKKDVIIKKI